MVAMHYLLYWLVSARFHSLLRIAMSSTEPLAPNHGPLFGPIRQLEGGCDDLHHCLAHPCFSERVKRAIAKACPGYFQPKSRAGSSRQNATPNVTSAVKCIQGQCPVSEDLPARPSPSTSTLPRSTSRIEILSSEDEAQSDRDSFYLPGYDSDDDVCVSISSSLSFISPSSA